MHSPKTRYLIFFQYFGTKYSGVMESVPDQPTRGVQNYLEQAAQKLRPVTPIKFCISSRTDTGVHALCNAAHIDVQRAAEKPPFHESIIVSTLNHFLKPEPIRRIVSAYRVPENFNARFSALSRTYVYRLMTGSSHHSQVPVFERDLCWAPGGGHLNVPAMQEAACFLLGTHDFSTFRSVSSDLPFRSPVKRLDHVDIRPSSGFMSHHYEYRGLQFWEVEFKSQSFLYKQVRRMVGALVAVGQGKLAPYHIKELLEIRNPLAYPVHLAPAAGLFLKSVEYNEAGITAFFLRKLRRKEIWRWKATQTNSNAVRGRCATISAVTSSCAEEGGWPVQQRCPALVSQWFAIAAHNGAQRPAIA
uniref:tRNA pseudouridine synthase n=1 Tax=Pelusios castaneus TaxID=367368 RepID=A0A8C8SLZ3_9SAUR